MRLIVVDPRRTDVARRADRHLQARPGTDVYILAALLSIILEEGLEDREFVGGHTSGLHQLRRAVAPFTPEFVSRAADVPVADLIWAAVTFGSARRGFAVGGTGPQMTTHGVLVEYLLLNLEAVCGHYLRAGEVVRNPGTLLPTHCAPKAQASPPRSPYPNDRPPFRVRGLSETVAGPPTAALPDEILLDGPSQIRALISLSGNPAAAIPGKRKVIEALRSLDLLVQIDPWMSETAQLAHYVIAPTVWLEAAGATVVQDYITKMAPGYGYADSYAQYSPAVASRPRGAELIEEWQFFYRLARHLGVQLSLQGRMLGSTSIEPIDMTREPDPDDLLGLISSSGRVTFDGVRRHDSGAFHPQPTVIVAGQDPDWSGKLELADPAMIAALAKFAAASEDADSRLPLRLIPRRAQHVHNSSCNVPETNRGRPYNPAFLAPRDMRRLRLASGDLVEIHNTSGSIIAVAEEDADLRSGVVSMTHCFGTLEPDVERRNPRQYGASTNWLTSNSETYDPYTGQPQMSNVAVGIRRVRG
jgi:anaerobic selenocysteine-containing dehydrogenase